jgi:predicted Zn-dependent protease
MMADPQSAANPTSPVEAEVLRIRGLLEQRRFVDALTAANALAVQVPENRDVLYMAAVSHRYLNQIPAALGALDRLERHHPRFSRLHQERGHCYVALRDATRAIEAFLAAVNINLALPASWGMLESLYRMKGNRENAQMAADHVATLKTMWCLRLRFSWMAIWLRPRPSFGHFC